MRLRTPSLARPLVPKVARIRFVCGDGAQHEVDVSHVDFSATGLHVPSVPDAFQGKIERVYWLDAEGRTLAQGAVVGRVKSAVMA